MEGFKTRNRSYKPIIEVRTLERNEERIEVEEIVGYKVSETGRGTRKLNESEITKDEGRRRKNQSGKG